MQRDWRRYEAADGVPPTREGGPWVARIRDRHSGDFIPTGSVERCAEDAVRASVLAARDWNARWWLIEHDRRMFRDITLPFVVGMASFAWTLAVYFGWPEALVCLSLPGVAYAGWKLAPFLHGER